MSTSASPASAGRWTSSITPVDVSLCAHAMTSASGSAVGCGAVPGSELTTIGSSRNVAPGQLLQRLRTDLRGSAAEPSVGGQELGGDLDGSVVGHAAMLLIAGARP